MHLESHFISSLSVCFSFGFRSWWKTLPLLCLREPSMGLSCSLDHSLASVSQIFLFHYSSLKHLTCLTNNKSFFIVYFKWIMHNICISVCCTWTDVYALFHRAFNIKCNNTWKIYILTLKNPYSSNKNDV